MAAQRTSTETKLSAHTQQEQAWLWLGSCWDNSGASQPPATQTESGAGRKQPERGSQNEDRDRDGVSSRSPPTQH